VEKILTGNGYTVVSVPDAEQALSVYESVDGDFKLIFSDVVLPGKDGVALVDELKLRDPELSILLASGYSPDTDLNAIKDRGYRFLHKPYALPELLEAIAELLVNRH
jgi:DNA-binding NtrC family response regulator